MCPRICLVLIGQDAFRSLLFRLLQRRIQSWGWNLPRGIRPITRSFVYSYIQKLDLKIWIRIYEKDFQIQVFLKDFISSLNLIPLFMTPISETWVRRKSRFFQRKILNWPAHNCHRDFLLSEVFRVCQFRRTLHALSATDARVVSLQIRSS